MFTLQEMRGALRDGGVVCTQGESMWLHADLIADVLPFYQTI
jgi:spermidine synthase